VVNDANAQTLCSDKHCPLQTEKLPLRAIAKKIPGSPVSGLVSGPPCHAYSTWPIYVNLRLQKGVKLELPAGVFHRQQKANTKKHKQTHKNTNPTNKNQRRADESSQKGRNESRPQTFHFISSTL